MRSEDVKSCVWRLRFPRRTGLPQSFTLYLAPSESDFRGIYEPLLANADGVIGLVPAELSRINESPAILVSVHQVLQQRRASAQELRFLLQYHYPAGAQAPAPEQIDQALGVNPKAVARIFTSADSPNQSQAVATLLEECLRLSSDPQ